MNQIFNDLFLYVSIVSVPQDTTVGGADPRMHLVFPTVSNVHCRFIGT